jgi:hypothetical protein
LNPFRGSKAQIAHYRHLHKRNNVIVRMGKYRAAESAVQETFWNDNARLPQQTPFQAADKRQSTVNQA